VRVKPKMIEQGIQMEISEVFFGINARPALIGLMNLKHRNKEQRYRMVVKKTSLLSVKIVEKGKICECKYLIRII
jgi:hypothetical protein